MKDKPLNVNMVLLDIEILDVLEEGHVTKQGKDVEMVDVPKERRILEKEMTLKKRLYMMN